MADKARVRVRLYRRRNTLKDKALGIGGLPTNADGKPVMPQIDAEALEQAEKLFQEMSEDYPDWVQGLINDLADLHRRCVDTPQERRGIFEKVSTIAHDMKGQGGTFGYPLITQFADSLYDIASIRGNYTDNVVEVIKAHIDSMRAVIRERVSGDGGEIGAQLADSLKSTIEKYKD